MPLWMGYDDELGSKIADLNNVAASGFAGAIFGALFLKRFVTERPHWLHLDLVCLESEGAPGPRCRRRGAGGARRVLLFARALRYGVIMCRRNPKSAGFAERRPTIRAAIRGWWSTASNRRPRAPCCTPWDSAMRDFDKAAGRHRLDLEQSHALQHAHRRARAPGRGRGRSAGRQGRDLQHHHRVRRHFDGHAGHALLAGVARGDRRFDRDGGRRPGLRRRGGLRRLRQEHAGLLDGAGAARPPRGLRLRRHHPAREPTSATSCRCSRRSAAMPQGTVSEHAAQIHRAHGDSRSGVLRRHVHGEHHGLGDRGAWA